MMGEAVVVVMETPAGRPSLRILPREMELIRATPRDRWIHGLREPGIFILGYFGSSRWEKRLGSLARSKAFAGQLAVVVGAVPDDMRITRFQSRRRAASRSLIYPSSRAKHISRVRT